VKRPATPLTHGFDGSETIASNVRRDEAKYDFASSITNVDRGSSKTRRVDVRVGVAYGSDLEKAMHLLYSVATADPDVRQTPPPAVLFQGFGDSAQNLELRFWLRVGAQVDVKSRVSIAVAQAFQEAGIEIPVPQRDIRVRSMDVRSVDEDAEEFSNRGGLGAQKTE